MILALLAALAGSIALAATGGTAEVRIQAQKLEDGRVEFALQQRDGGGWGERILPRVRCFPSGAPAGQWLSSSPVEVSVSDEPIEDDASPELGDHNIRRTAGGGITQDGAYWSVWFDDFTDVRLAAVRAASELRQAAGLGGWLGGWAEREEPKLKPITKPLALEPGRLYRYRGFHVTCIGHSKWVYTPHPPDPPLRFTSLRSACRDIDHHIADLRSGPNGQRMDGGGTAGLAG